MAELDRLQWEDSLIFRAFGITMGIRVDDVALLDAVPPYLPYGWKPAQREAVDRLYSLRTDAASGETGSYVLYRDASECARGSELGLVLDSLEREIRWELAENAHGRIFVHAGVVGWLDRGIVLLGTSGAGKSTLVSELVRAGATYYSDEYAVLDSRGRAHPFATELHLRKSGERKQERRTVESLGGRSGRKPLPVGLALAAAYHQGASTRLRALTPAHAVLELLQGTAARSRPHETLHALEQVASRAPVLTGERGDVRDFVPQLLATLSRTGDWSKGLLSLVREPTER